MVDRAALSAAKDINYTAERVLHALELIVFEPSSPPRVAAAIGVTRVPRAGCCAR